MALYLILASAFFAAMQNLCMRRSVDTGGSTTLYVPIQLLISCLIAILLGPVRQHDFVMTLPTAAIGLGMGLVLGVMMWGLGESLKFGSPALTFAVLNSCSVIPAVIMALIFGGNFGHPYKWWNGVGSMVVIGGIFWSSWKTISCKNKIRWAFFISLASVAFILFSAATQWRVLLDSHASQHALLPAQWTSAHSQWISPAIFLGAALFQIFGLRKMNSHSLSKDTLIYGVLGGVANGSSMFLMILAAEQALEWQNAILFPVFSIMIIQICNLWGRYLYKEKIDWAPQTLCLGGLILGSVCWSKFFQ